jgi:hypothetical protein
LLKEEPDDRRAAEPPTRAADEPVEVAPAGQAQTGDTP